MGDWVPRATVSSLLQVEARTEIEIRQLDCVSSDRFYYCMRSDALNRDVVKWTGQRLGNERGTQEVKW